MIGSIAQPRARRRRLKPPPPSFWRALFWVCWDIVFATLDIVWMLGADAAWKVAFFGFFAALMIAILTTFSWPRFRRELERWWDDDA